MTRHTKAQVRGAVDAVRQILMASRRPLTSVEIADLLCGDFTRQQVTRAAANLCRYGGFRRITDVDADGGREIRYGKPEGTVAAPMRTGISRPASKCALQEVWG